MYHLIKILVYRRAALGLEWRALKKLPVVVLGGTLIPLFISVIGRALAPDGSAAQVNRYLTGLDIMTVSIALTVWMTALAVAIGCIAVLMMKGPATTAGAYPLVEPEPVTD